MAKIHTALIEAMRDICKTGIGKLSRADMGNTRYNFRGIDAAMNEMSPILVNNGITVTPRYSELTITERAKDGGKATRFCSVKGSFTFAVDDDSSVTAEAYGEAMDSGDKATIKAQSVAFRTVLFQQFIVPVMAMDTELEGDDSEDTELDSWRATALDGYKVLQQRYQATPPAASFWKRHSQSLKDAAKQADAEGAKQ